MSDDNDARLSGEDERKNDICPECGCVGEFLGESVSGGPSVGAGAPNHTEHYRCRAENCDKEWTA